MKRGLVKRIVDGRTRTLDYIKIDKEFIYED